MNNKPTTYLPALLLCLAALVGCSQEGTPYTEKTAAIDPAMQQEDPDMTTQPDAQPPTPTPAANDGLDPTAEKIELTDAQWRAVLSNEEYYVLRKSGTEYPGTGRYLDNGKEDKGAYHCVGCGNYLYDAKHKFHSGCGWPSFNQEVKPGAITTHVDASLGAIRTEMRCARCDGHLGHIFEDGFDQPTGLRHCVNGTALIFVPEGQTPQDVIREHRAKHASK